MSIRPNSMAKQFVPRRGRVARGFIAGLTLMLFSVVSKTAVAAPEDDGTIGVRSLRRRSERA